MTEMMELLFKKSQKGAENGVGKTSKKNVEKLENNVTS